MIYRIWVYPSGPDDLKHITMSREEAQKLLEDLKTEYGNQYDNYKITAMRF